MESQILRKQRLRHFIENNLYEGIFGALGAVAKAPFSATKAVIKGTGQAIAAPVKVASTAVGTGFKAVGKTITLRPGQAMDTVKQGVSKIADTSTKPLKTAGYGVLDALSRPVQKLSQ